MAQWCLVVFFCGEFPQIFYALLIFHDFLSFLVESTRPKDCRACIEFSHHWCVFQHLNIFAINTEAIVFLQNLQSGKGATFLPRGLYILDSENNFGGFQKLPRDHQLLIRALNQVGSFLFPLALFLPLCFRPFLSFFFLSLLIF